MAAYTGSGSIQLKGCAGVVGKYFYQTKFGERSAAYTLQKAKKGIIEKIVVKQVILHRSPKTYNQIVWLYKDTFNGLWNESDLLTHQEAIDIATAYLEKKQAEAQAWKC
jgi:hypothetical protein